MLSQPPESCDNPIIVDNFPPSENSEYRIICNFTPVIKDNKVGTATKAKSYIYVSSNHNTNDKTYHYTQDLQTDKGYFYTGTQVYDLSGNEKVGYFGYYTPSVSKVPTFLWSFTGGIGLLALVLFFIYSFKRPRIVGEMQWWQELIFLGCLFLLFLLYGGMAIIMLAR